MATPNSYKDPYWSDLASSTESKLGLPSGLLASIVTQGEKSNNDQVSEAGAKTPFQIIPSTRKAALDKYGIDAYESPEDAAQVAGLLLKDSLERNKGNVASAVAEYHGGTNPANWGPKTRAYMNRVLSNTPQQSQQLDAQPDSPMQSTFDKVLAQLKSSDKTDQSAGGQKLNISIKKPDPLMLPKEVTDAYVGGKLSVQQRSALERDIKDGVVKLPPTNASQIPDNNPNFAPPTEQGVIQKQPEPSLADKAIGAGEAALATGTGIVGGTAGMIGGAAEGLTQQILSGQFGTPQAAQAVEASAMKRANQLTYQPRTQTGQEYTQAVGDASQQLIPLTPLGPEMAAIGQASKAAIPMVQPALDTVIQPVTNGARRVVDTMRRADVPVTAPANLGSAGAEAVDAGLMRQTKANELDVPIDLTQGQKTRSFGDQQFEREIAKDADLGEPVRKRFEDQNLKLQQNLESMIDSTDAQAPDLRSLGESVKGAVTKQFKKDKAEVRANYTKAEKAGELEEPVTLDKVVDHLNQFDEISDQATILNSVRKGALKRKLATENENGELVATPGTLAKAESLRQLINSAVDDNPPNIRQASILKGLIDDQTEGLGGNLYKEARASRKRVADDYENVGLVDNLLSSKRGSNDAKIALEDVLRKTVIDPSTSLDSLVHLDNLLKKSGKEGLQARKELQGGTLNWIRSEATKNVQRNSAGDPIVSASQLDKAINTLDKSGKLDYLFGKPGAEKLRTLNDVAKDVLTSPPGSVNHSNTASVLLAALDIAVSGTVGVPAPIASGLRLITKGIKSAKTKARIRQHLGIKDKNA
jgi:hypothetical protein